MPVKGELWLDRGAVEAVKQHSKSLFAAGILNIQGAFAAQDAVVLCDASGIEFARGLCNYTCQELLKVQVSNLVRSGQVRSGQVRSGQVRSGQVRSGQVRSGLTVDMNKCSYHAAHNKDTD